MVKTLGKGIMQSQQKHGLLALTRKLKSFDKQRNYLSLPETATTRNAIQSGNNLLP